MPKGRPPKSVENSNYSIIKDPLMEPFYIQKDKYNFNVMEVTTPTRGFAGKKAKEGKTVDKLVGHYTSFKNALNIISRKKFYENKGEYNSIKEYLESWTKLKDGMETLLNQIEI